MDVVSTYNIGLYTPSPPSMNACNAAWSWRPAGEVDDPDAPISYPAMDLQDCVSTLSPHYTGILRDLVMDKWQKGYCRSFAHGRTFERIFNDMCAIWGGERAPSVVRDFLSQHRGYSFEEVEELMQSTSQLRWEIGTRQCWQEKMPKEHKKRISNALKRLDSKGMLPEGGTRIAKWSVCQVYNEENEETFRCNLELLGFDAEAAKRISKTRNQLNMLSARPQPSRFTYAVNWVASCVNNCTRPFFSFHMLWPRDSATEEKEQEDAKYPPEYCPSGHAVRETLSKDTELFERVNNVKNNATAVQQEINARIPDAMRKECEVEAQRRIEQQEIREARQKQRRRRHKARRAQKGT